VISIWFRFNIVIEAALLRRETLRLILAAVATWFEKGDKPAESQNCHFDCSRLSSANDFIPAGSRSYLATLNLAKFPQAWLDETGREGLFEAINMSALSEPQQAELIADEAEGLYIRSRRHPEYVLRRVEREVLTPEMFGAVGNGVTNDDIALQGMASVGRARKRLQMRGLKGKTYTYSQPFWLSGIQNVDIDGAGCSFRNILGSRTPEIFDIVNYVGLALPCATNTYAHNCRRSFTELGTRIATVASGARIVEALELHSVKAGDRVLIYGFDRQVTASDPPCARYFEVNFVERTEGEQIILRAPLRYSYDSRWFDGLHFSNGGTPRILSLDRQNFTQIERFHIRNITIDPNPAWNTTLATPERNGRLQIYGCDEVVLENVTSQSLYVGQVGYFRAESCTFTNVVEIDKLIDKIYFKVCDLPSTGGWTSVRNAVLEDCRQTSGPISFGAMETAEIRGGFFRDEGSGSSRVILGTPDFLTNTLLINGATFEISNPVRDHLIEPYTFTTEVTEVLGPSTFELGTRAEFDATLIARMLYDGIILFAPNGTPALRLTSLPYMVGNRVRIEGEPIQRVTVGTPLAVCSLENLIVRNARYEGNYAFQGQSFDSRTAAGTNLYPRTLDDRRSMNKWRVESSDVKGDESFSTGTYFKFGSTVEITRIIVEVRRPYTGPSRVRMLRLISLKAVPGQLALINLKFAGCRELTISAASGGKPEDELSHLHPDRLKQLRFLNEGSLHDIRLASEEPEWTCTIDGRQD
jgi:hypothetical protein